MVRSSRIARGFPAANRSRRAGASSRRSGSGRARLFAHGFQRRLRRRRPPRPGSARQASRRDTAACRRCRRPAVRRGRSPLDSATADLALRSHFDRKASPARAYGCVGEPAQSLLDEGAAPAAVDVAPAAADCSAGRWAVPNGMRHDERTSLAEHALGFDRAAVQLHQFLHQGQPDAAAFVGRPRGTFDAVEPLEKPGQLLGGDADAGVPHAQLGRSGPPAAARPRSRPRSVNLKALETRFRTIFSHMSRST